MSIKLVMTVLLWRGSPSKRRRRFYHLVVRGCGTWKRPEHGIGWPGASDLAGSMVGALVSTALVFKQYGNNTDYYNHLMGGATQLYEQVRKSPLARGIFPT
jgi:hypothetical protein